VLTRPVDVLEFELVGGREVKTYPVPLPFHETLHLL
jgi:hypothetical protein